jgi:hypothetical protein
MAGEPENTYPVVRCVTAAELEVGEVYFEVAYLDPDLRVPFVKPTVFLGTDIDGGRDDLLYFQDAASYVTFGRDPGGEAEVVTRTDRQLNSIFSLAQAIEELKHCLTRRASLDSA